MSNPLACKWLLGCGVTTLGMGISSIVATEPFLRFWGVDTTRRDVVSLWSLFGIPLVSLGSLSIYASLGDDEEQKHMNRTGLLHSLLVLAWLAKDHTTGIFPSFAVNFWTGLHATYALLFGYFSYKLH